MSGVRFTTWLSWEERAALRKLARAHGTSANFVARVAIRSLLFDAPIPTYLQKGSNGEAPTSIAR